MATFAKCPVCEASVKGENLRRHVTRVHPREGPDLDLKGMGTHPRRRGSVLQKQTRKKAILASIVAVVLIASLIVAYSLIPGPPGGDGSIRVSPASHDFGDIDPELASFTFVIENVGEGDLVLLAIVTSCSCTSAVLTVMGRKSPTFGMHGNPVGWSESLGPGGQGQLTVTYDPNVHPDTGPIQRAVYITSNDSLNREVQVGITANVVRG
ncbi:MAG: hypothetical protein ACE5JE_05410 [Thermoplasmata archaeon]